MNATNNTPPLFSLLHTSARPDQWRAVYDDWMSKAKHPEQVEYVLCVDERWGFKSFVTTWREWMLSRDGLNRFVWNAGDPNRWGNVDGHNTAAKASTGDVLIAIADDQFACEGWDEAICERINTNWHSWPEDFVIEVSTGTPDEHNRGIMVMPILSRARYERLGYVFYPEYESMFADNEFCEHAKQDGVVIDARHLMFPHKHWYDGARIADRADVVQNDNGRYNRGLEILERRRACEFGSVVEPAKPAANNPPLIAFVTPGERFEREWVWACRLLDDHISKRFSLQRFMGQASSAYVVRQGIADSILAMEPRPDFVLWLDDDNRLTAHQFERLMMGLINNPKVDVIAGWCWIWHTDENQWLPSCGKLDGHTMQYASPIGIQQSQDLFEVDWTGFPAVLMRTAALECCHHPFRPINTTDTTFGQIGEDVSFCINLRKQLGQIMVDPQVRVPHMKNVDVEPRFTQAAVSSVPVGAPVVDGPLENIARMNRLCADLRNANPAPACKPKIIGAMRVRNEARWIKRVVKACYPLCEKVYVMDDQSTDGTVNEALAGMYDGCDPESNRYNQRGRVIPTIYAGLPLDEARDKQWLLGLIVKAENPDWIFFIDGDEELEPEGAAKILAAIEAANQVATPRVDAFWIKFLYLWDRPDQYRADRWYSQVKRASLFRPLPGVQFKSFYQGRGVHCGLHTGNAPLSLLENSAVLDVYLLHYGYMDKQRRIDKHEFYNSIDPMNEIEDFYRHIVQGDIPGVPASAVLKHAGPLELKPVPANMRMDEYRESILDLDRKIATFKAEMEAPTPRYENEISGQLRACIGSIAYG